jgi:hypothetical protein
MVTDELAEVSSPTPFTIRLSRLMLLPVLRLDFKEELPTEGLGEDISMDEAPSPPLPVILVFVVESVELFVLGLGEDC